eukprot:125904_1
MHLFIADESYLLFLIHLFTFILFHAMIDSTHIVGLGILHFDRREDDVIGYINFYIIFSIFHAELIKLYFIQNMIQNFPEIIDLTGDVCAQAIYDRTSYLCGWIWWEAACMSPRTFARIKTIPNVHTAARP